MKGELSRLQAGAASLGLALDDELALRLIDYLDELYRWNRVQRLTAIPREHAVEAQLLDSLALVDCLSGCSDIVDLGSGAGLPGVPLAVVMPGVRVTLVEKRRKRAGFLEQVVRCCELTDCSVINEDVESPEVRDRCFDAVVSRAFQAPHRFMETGAGLLRDGGRLLVMAGGTAAQPDPGHGGLQFERQKDYDLGWAGGRRLFVYRLHDDSQG
ncbi:MAG TPA: 16S rRNA (guanine(527)-N(7))-methyltransferase RsmG [Deltaproteobacteria bacterium]|nr:16S rRNA (guanine(527)-N(7))-methyltransferase RsmG [Candidatus Binatota bacterium]HIL12684.1 16S rRNA (guanine(527)-N(7))-methyltransferase RsmG [Deltaproteobacteria bacterium]